VIDLFGPEPIAVEHFIAVDSTNAEARRRAEQGERGPVWILADHQTAGRGRRGRAWQSGQGNFAATLLVTLPLSAAEAALVSFVAALAVADTLARVAMDDHVAIKWPNDVLLEGRKAAGILVESGQIVSAAGVSVPGGRELWLAVGIGVNLNTAPEATERPSTALAEHLRSGRLRPPNPRDFLTDLSEAFVSRARLWLSQGPEPLLRAYARQAAGLTGPCSVRLDAETLNGWADGLEPDGALRLRLPEGEIRRITAGDVFFPQGAETAIFPPSPAGTG
jgi:BirA family biotin operon repressor/biotin-[acetyl-CoA-carboxylase] ligase